MNTMATMQSCETTSLLPVVRGNHCDLVGKGITPMARGKNCLVN